MANSVDPDETYDALFRLGLHCLPDGTHLRGTSIIGSIIFRKNINFSDMITVLRPFMPNIFSHPYQLDESISNFDGCYDGCFFSCIPILKETSVSKQWRT